MSIVRFHAGDVDLELAGSEGFVTRQLQLLSPYLGDVDPRALEGAPAPAAVARPAAEPEPVAAEARDADVSGEAAPAPAAGGAPDAAAAVPDEASGGHVAPAVEPGNEIAEFHRAHARPGRDAQEDAALLFAYYLQRRRGMDELRIGDLIRCCIQAGVDTRNLHRTVGVLARRGQLETVRHGHAYRLSEQGASIVERRLA